MLGDLAEVGHEDALALAGPGEERVARIAQLLERFAEAMRRQRAHRGLADGRRLRIGRDLDAVVAEERKHRYARQLDAARSDALGARLGDLGDVVLQPA